MKKILLLTALFAATVVSAQQTDGKRHERQQPTAAQKARAKQAMKKAKKTLILPQAVTYYSWDITEEDWVYDAEIAQSYNEKGLLETAIATERDEEGNIMGRRRFSYEYNEDGNMTAQTVEIAMGESDEWENMSRTEYTYDAIVKDFRTSFIAKVWNGTEWVDYGLMPLVPKAPSKMIARKESPFKYIIERDEQNRVTHVEKQILTGEKDEESGETIFSYKATNFMDIAYDGDLPTTFTYTPEHGEIKAPAKSAKRKAAKKIPVSEHYTLTVTEWDTCDPTQLLGDPESLTEGANRIKKAEITYPWDEKADINVTYSDNGGFSKEMLFEDGYKEVHTLEYTDDNGSYIEDWDYIDEDDIDTETNLYWFEREREEFKFDDHGILTEIIYSDTEEEYNSGNPVLRTDWVEYQRPTYDEKEVLTELIYGYSEYSYQPATNDYLIEDYPDSKEVYSDFVEIIVDGIGKVKTENVQTTAAKFNIAGQRVSDSYKGVVIQNGKKFIQK